MDKYYLKGFWKYLNMDVSTFMRPYYQNIEVLLLFNGVF